MSNKTVLLTGGSGLIGTALADHLTDAGYKVIILSRNPLKAKAKQPFNENITFAQWNLKKQEIDTTAIATSNIIVHLAGAGVVDRPWTEAYKKTIIDSRTQSSALIIKGLQNTPNKVETVVSASAIGYYGEDKIKNRAFTESDPPAENFLGNTCQLWEESIKPVTDLGARLAIFRFGIVLSKDGGALSEFLKPLMLRIATVLGKGEQVISWIHIKDLARMIQFAIEHPGVQGVYNAVTPNPVSNRELVKTLGRTLYGRFFITLPVPEFILKAMMGDRSMEVLKSATVSPGKILEAGFQFNFPAIKEALKHLTG